MIAQVGGHDPWEIEISIWIEKGADPDVARAFTIMRWMEWGDLRPLSAAIRQSHELDEAVLNVLAQMIDDGRLIVKARGRGRRQSPAGFARDVVAFRLYDRAKKSEEDIAAMLGMSVESVHQAIIAMRKAHRAVKEIPIC